MSTQEEHLHTTIRNLEIKIKDLQKRNQELESFAYVASHDLQEPLRKIHIFSERILEAESEHFSPDTTDNFKRILSAAGRMKKLIDALLNYSRTNTDEKVFIEQNLNKLLEEVKSDLNEAILEKKATITSDELPTLPIIPHQFIQLLENLVSNSLKYSSEASSPVIDIRSKKVTGAAIRPDINPQKEYWQISVADNGIGFENEYNERIFEIFQRLHGKHEYEGTGIGLAICKKIVQNHNGYIQAEGAVNKGATVKVFLPVE